MECKVRKDIKTSKEKSVLMEPKWNVKQCFIIPTTKRICINGTKVECKVSCQGIHVIFSCCINGTKVECKVRQASVNHPSSVVLMEPKWNVKDVNMAVVDFKNTY